MTRIESSFRELVDLATNPTPLEEHFYQEMDLMVRISGMINALPEKERGKWITHILGSMVAAIEAAKVAPPLVPSRN